MIVANKKKIKKNIVEETVRRNSVNFKLYMPLMSYLFG